MELRKNLSLKSVSALAVALLLIGAGCASSDQPQVQVDTDTGSPVDVQVQPVPPPSQPTSSAEPPPTTTTGEPPKAVSYKDGTYTADGTYEYHSGTETITVGLTVKNGKVTDTTFAAVPSVPMSARFQKMFSDNYKPLVVGKSLSDVCALGKVSGSSLTPNGFNDACLKIQAQAKA